MADERHDDERDDLDDWIAETTAKNPDFPRLIEEAVAERKRRVERGEED